MAGIVGTHLVAQVGFIVKDIEATKRKWAAFLGVDVPPTQPCGDYEITRTEYFIANLFQVFNFIIINADKDDTIIRK